MQINAFSCLFLYLSDLDVTLEGSTKTQGTMAREGWAPVAEFEQNWLFLGLLTSINFPNWSETAQKSQKNTKFAWNSDILKLKSM